jgi:hypothetical protein
VCIGENEWLVKEPESRAFGLPCLQEKGINTDRASIFTSNYGLLVPVPLFSIELRLIDPGDRPLSPEGKLLQFMPIMTFSTLDV